MRVVCMLGKIKEELGWNNARLARELGIDVRTIEKLIDDEPWSLKREVLHRYYLFAHEKGFDPFRIEPNPIWRTFENSDARIFRGPKSSDVPVEHHLSSYFGQLNCSFETSIASEDLEAAMRERNCVIIGSPKGNPASERALSLLWTVEPLKEEGKTLPKAPLCFVGVGPAYDKGSALLEASTPYGISIVRPDNKKKIFVKVDWLPPEKFGPFEGTGQEAALLVACNRPLGTQEDVTTIIIAGYTGLSTFTATRQATHKEMPDLRLEESPGEPCLALMKFRYTKKRQRRSHDDPREADEKSIIWAPPWGAFS